MGSSENIENNDFYIGGILYRNSEKEVPRYRCKNCLRITLTGLCGCNKQEPIHIDNVFVAYPVTGEIVPLGEQ